MASAHHPASASDDITRISHRLFHLMAADGLPRVFRSRSLVGADRRAAELLAVAGLYASAARFARKATKSGSVRKTF
jgi:hypothetical protein